MKRCVARATLALATGALTAALTLAGAVAQPRASLAEIEGQVMCPVCGTLLELSQSPQAERERVFVRRLIARGETTAQIKDALVAQYGPNVLATPRASGFDLSAYWLPAVAFLVAAAAMLLGVWRWRRAGGATAEEPPTGEQNERLKADMAHYDL